MLAPKRAAFFKAQGKATRGTSGSRCPGERMRSKIGRAKSAADKRSVIETEINRGSFRSRDPPTNAMSMARPMIEVVFQPRAAPLLVILALVCHWARKKVARFGLSTLAHRATEPGSYSLCKIKSRYQLFNSPPYGYQPRLATRIATLQTRMSGGPAAPDTRMVDNSNGWQRR